MLTPRGFGRTAAPDRIPGTVGNSRCVDGGERQHRKGCPFKYDGHRLLARIGDPALRLREGGEAPGWFPELHDPLATLPAACVLDAEGVILDDIGRPDFNAFHERALRRRWYRGARAVALAVFDILVLRGQDIRDWPIEKRKAALQKLLHGVKLSLLYVSATDTCGQPVPGRPVRRLAQDKGTRLPPIGQVHARADDLTPTILPAINASRE